MSRKRRSLKQFTVYLILALLTGLTLYFYPFSKTLQPLEVSEYSQLNTMKDADYVNFKAEKLYYTGCDYVTNKTVKGHYYYALSEKHCVYVLLKTNKKGEAQQIIESANINCKIIKQEKAFNNLTDSLANQLDWTNKNLEKIVYPYILSQPHYPLFSTCLALAALCLQFTLLAAFAAYSLYRFLIRKHK